MKQQPETLRHEDAAEWVSVKGWRCVKCHRFYSSDPSGERAARYCCSTDQPCGTLGCDGRARKGWAACLRCIERKAGEKWAALPRVEWDGEAPVCLWDDDRYFFDVDDLRDHMDAYEIIPEQVRLVLCEPDNGRAFDMEEFLEVHLPCDGDYEFPHDATEINAAVNAWIEAHAPYSWSGGNQAVSAASIRTATGYEDEEDWRDER